MRPREQLLSSPYGVFGDNGMKSTGKGPTNYQSRLWAVPMPFSRIGLMWKVCRFLPAFLYSQARAELVPTTKRVLQMQCWRWILCLGWLHYYWHVHPRSFGVFHHGSHNGLASPPPHLWRWSSRPASCSPVGRDLGYSGMTFEIDCKMVVDHIRDKSNSESEYGVIIQSCSVVLASLENFKVY